MGEKSKRPARKKRRKPVKEDGRSLVVVESPAKSKTINKILGRKYVVKASMGHVMDLPKRKFGIDVENGFEPTYKLITKRRDTVKELRELAKRAPEVFLATDPDREGEAISWHLITALRLPERKVRRVSFNEITREGIRKAFSHPGAIAMDLVHAQQARRLLDRIVGYKLSPLLWEKIAKRLSAGRVQSVALKFIVDREREIRAFKPVEYWDIRAKLSAGTEVFEAALTKVDGKSPALGSASEAQSLVEELGRETFTVSGVTEKERLDRPYAPLTTSLLQQRASVELGFSAKRTMMVAQQLYEGVEIADRGPVGLITYMRTDSFRIAEEALGAARSFIGETYGEAYVPDKPNRYSRKGKRAQDAHEAIRPTSVELTPPSVRDYLTTDQYKIYNLIWRRFISCQMTPARFFTTEIRIRAGRGLFVARGRRLTFDGYLKVLKTAGKEDQRLPGMREGDALKLLDLIPTQHFTEPPPRLTEASLIKVLEKHGIGRPSTYAPTLSTLVARGYVRTEGRKLIPSDLGILVTEKLERHFERFVDRRFTANMEEQLDLVESGEADWTQVLREFHEGFIPEIERARAEMESEHGKSAGEHCPKCATAMISRWTRFGRLIQCPKEECGHKKPPKSAEIPGRACPSCGKPVFVKWGRWGKFLACTQYPDCTTTRSILRGDKIVKLPDDFDQRCEKCDSPLAVRVSKRGAFLGCTGYPKCRNAKKVPPAWIVDLYPTGSKAIAFTPEEIEDKEEAA